MKVNGIKKGRKIRLISTLLHFQHPARLHVQYFNMSPFPACFHGCVTICRMPPPSASPTIVKNSTYFDQNKKLKQHKERGLSRPEAFLTTNKDEMRLLIRREIVLELVFNKVTHFPCMDYSLALSILK